MATSLREQDEKRIDITDGNPYPRESFLEYYPHDGQSRWDHAPLWLPFLVASASPTPPRSSNEACFTEDDLGSVLLTLCLGHSLCSSQSMLKMLPGEVLQYHVARHLRALFPSPVPERLTPQHAGIIRAMEDALINADYVQIGDEDSGHPHLAYMGRKGHVVAFTIKHNVWIELRERVGAQRRRRQVMAPFTDKALQRLMHDLGFKAARTTPSDPECDRLFAYDRAKYMRHGGRSLPGGKGLAPAARGRQSRRPTPVF
jgi:hypothetical protein